MDFNYFFENTPNPHNARRRKITKEFPGVKNLAGHNNLSGVFVLLIVLFQIGLAFFFGSSDWVIIVLAAFTIGAFGSHALFALIHEATHNLIFEGSALNKIFGIICNVGQGYPSAISFRKFHLLHHNHMGESGFDADLAFDSEAKWVKNSPLRKSLWLFFFGIVESFRPLKIKASFWDAWVLSNLVLIILSNFLIYYFCGIGGLIFILLSTFFSVGLHPLGARWIQEHFVFQKGQETYSYYGILNKIQFNIGYHNEHHDFPNIPWNHLTTLRKAAPTHYDNIYYHKSWTKLMFQFIFDRKITLFSRIIRN
jgi:sphingolipid 4-desaturase/C4-monooxygenase